MRRLLSSKSKNELLNLIRDIYILTTDNKDFVHAQALTPKSKTPKPRQPKKPPSRTSKVVPKIRQLANIAMELHEGASFNITRLTTLKSLCEDATAAARFAVHLAQLTDRKMREKACPAHLDPEKWEYYKQVVDEAIRQMARYMEKPTEEAADLVRAWLSDVRAIQDRYEQQA
jgi:hypothetical protein